MIIDIIRHCINEDKITWTTHCTERMQDRDISREDIINCILLGEVIEDYPNSFPHPSCLVFGYKLNNQVIHVVVGTDNAKAYIITTYYPTTDKFLEDLKTRR